MRHPDEILSDLDTAQELGDLDKRLGVNLRDLIWEVINDIRDSLRTNFDDLDSENPDVILCDVTFDGDIIP